MIFSRRTLSVVTVLLLVGVLGGGIYWRLRPEAGGEAQAAETSDGSDTLSVPSAVEAFSTEMPQAVSGVAAVRDTLWISVNASGKAEAYRRAVVRAQVEGVIEAIPVRENSAVAGGQAILQIDTTELALAVARARSDLLNARAEYRTRVLFDDEIEDEEVRRQREEVARAQSGLNSAEVALRQAELQLQRSTVRAPFEGRIADLLVVPGQHVGAGADLMTVVDIDPLKVEAQVMEAALPQLREGRRARMVFAALPQEIFAGTIQTINPVVDPEENAGRVTVLMRNPDGRVKPGMYAEVRLEARSFPDRILVPRSAVLERGEEHRTMVFVYSGDDGGGEALWQYVCTGEENETLVEIVPCDEGSLEPGQIVLTEGHHYLAHQTRVRLVENPELEGGRPGR